MTARIMRALIVASSEDILPVITFGTHISPDPIRANFRRLIKRLEEPSGHLRDAA